MNVGMSEERESREGKVARGIEKRTAKLPSDLFLWMAGGAIIGSAALQILGGGRKMGPFGRKEKGSTLQRLSLFVGEWAPTFLMLGLYNKIVKVAGRDRYEQRRSATP
jgi:hypothetical protein